MILKILSAVTALTIWTVSAHACPMHKAQANAVLEPAAGDAATAGQDAAGNEQVEAVTGDSPSSGAVTSSEASRPANSMYRNLNE